MRLVKASSVGVTGPRPAGPFCAPCDDELSHLYALFLGAGGLGFCCCGCPDDAYALVRDLLALAPFHEGWETGESNGQKARALLGGGEAAFYLTAYTLDKVGLLDHGTSISGARPALKGTHYLALMRKHEWDNVAAAGYPHDDADGDCGPGCPTWEASTEDYLKDQARREAAEARRAGDWQVLPPNVWAKLDGADAMVLAKSKTWIKSRPGGLSDGK